MAKDWLSAEEEFEMGRNANVKFVVNGHEIKANRFRVELHSDVFKAMFANDFKKRGGKFEIKNATLGSLTKLVRSCYCPISVDSIGEALELFELAHRYNVVHVSTYCEDYIARRDQQLIEHNVIDFFRVGDLCSSTIIKTCALNRMLKLQCCYELMVGREKLTEGQLREILRFIWPKKERSLIHCNCPDCDFDRLRTLGFIIILKAVTSLRMSPYIKTAMSGDELARPCQPYARDMASPFAARVMFSLFLCLSLSLSLSFSLSLSRSLPSDSGCHLMIGSHCMYMCVCVGCVLCAVSCF